MNKSLVAFFISMFPALVIAQCISPTLAKKIENYEIIAGNIATIPASEAFKGSDIHFSVTAKNHKANTVTIDSTTGVLSINAKKKGHFDVQVRAENDCGKMTTSFNVIIDEEV